VNDLVVNNELATAVVDNQSSDAASAIREGALDLGEEVVIVNDGQTLLDIACVGHADNAAIVSDVEDAVLHEDWSEHALHVYAGLRVGAEAGLFLQFLGEQVHTEVAILTSLSRSTDADNLTRAILQNH
jgi:hypothetical protein